jgi:hypothetical protein
VKAQIRKARPDTAALADFAVDMTDPDNGIVTISLSGAQTAGLLTGTATEFGGVWDIQWTADGGSPATILQGEVSCVLDVTR